MAAPAQRPSISSSASGPRPRAAGSARLVPRGPAGLRVPLYATDCDTTTAPTGHEVGDRGDRGHPAGEADRAAAGTLQGGEDLLERGPRRVADPGVGDRAAGGEGRAEHGRGVHRGARVARRAARGDGEAGGRQPGGQVVRGSAAVIVGHAAAAYRLRAH